MEPINLQYVGNLKDLHYRDSILKFHFVSKGKNFFFQNCNSFKYYARLNRFFIGNGNTISCPLVDDSCKASKKCFLSACFDKTWETLSDSSAAWAANAIVCKYNVVIETIDNYTIHINERAGLKKYIEKLRIRYPNITYELNSDM